MTSEEKIMKNALSHRPETCSAREMTAPSSARPFQYSSSQMSEREDSWVVNRVSTTGTRWSCSWFDRLLFQLLRQGDVPPQVRVQQLHQDGTAKKIKFTLQLWRMEDRQEMEDKKRYYLDVRNPSSRQPPPRSVA